MQQPDPHSQIFEGERRRLAGLAYRMTGSVAETDDILQEAALKFRVSELSRIDRPARWLSTVVMRLCLDHLRSARTRRETYVGAWLPDPLIADQSPGAESDWMKTEDVGIALILTLDTLTPEMRAAFILRDAFDYSFDKIAQLLGKTDTACRQLVSRARRKLAGAEPVDPPSRSMNHPLVTAFWEASRLGDMDRLLTLFADDIEVHTDGGGKVPAAINVLHGSRKAAQLFAGLARKQTPPTGPCPPLRWINGSPGFLSTENGVLQTTALSIRNSRIGAIWIVRNPEKLQHVRPCG
ncbi:RNA polymerase sigma factor SigJ [Limimaricola pyoseonensis]|uniref:RNA polymerase sigma-70 factor, ECF subfamily n=1 Tax=Limimaricola pyoseonensis TaxID=521013 RepID=A0A1G7K3B0_9RHOB|nr:RNA polymerase sigma factor SigJ [Limimaricola pyoseonensis]SDF31685.1 RNA polymerase sigma-70 factor, ECF subfamily [Limimaricola pyoseonensis]